jgi:hypothetical protein
MSCRLLTCKQRDENAFMFVLSLLVFLFIHVVVVIFQSNTHTHTHARAIISQFHAIMTDLNKRKTKHVQLVFFQMSKTSSDLILFDSVDSLEKNSNELRQLFVRDFPTSLIIHSYDTCEQIIEFIQSRVDPKRALFIVTTFNMSPTNSTESLVKSIRRTDKSTFIILYSQQVCSDSNLRYVYRLMSCQSD